MNPLLSCGGSSECHPTQLTLCIINTVLCIHAYVQYTPVVRSHAYILYTQYKSCIHACTCIQYMHDTHTVKWYTYFLEPLRHLTEFSHGIVYIFQVEHSLVLSMVCCSQLLLSVVAVCISVRYILYIYGDHIIWHQVYSHLIIFIEIQYIIQYC